MDQPVDAEKWSSCGIENVSFAGGALMIQSDDQMVMHEVWGITPENASNVLSVIGESGMKPGSFTSLLIQAMMNADPRNLGILSVSYPGLAQSVKIVRNEEFGTELLKHVSMPG